LPAVFLAGSFHQLACPPSFGRERLVRRTRRSYISNISPQLLHFCCPTTAAAPQLLQQQSSELFAAFVPYMNESKIDKSFGIENMCLLAKRYINIKPFIKSNNVDKNIFAMIINLFGGIWNPFCCNIFLNPRAYSCQLLYLIMFVNIILIMI
jgi:hypothetical protein